MRLPLLSLLLLGTAALAEAQVRPVSVAVPAKAMAPAATGSANVPVAMLPPAGLCRIWINEVPASQQPAPTDCATALRQRPANGTILYGPTERDSMGERFEEQARARRESASRAAGPAASPSAKRPAAPRERKPREGTP
ncbi:MAG: hypothetical protein FJ362_02640 [Gemmatimonadetes bacterium]|nr:hypothetical protein [Gemmatimonadota bacterium]